jgi:hypothetical protein
MTFRLVAIVILMLGVGLCGVASTLVIWRMADEVNQKLPEAERFEWLGWHLTKRRRLQREYLRLCPGGHRARQLRFLLLSAFALVVLAAAILGIVP